MCRGGKMDLELRAYYWKHYGVDTWRMASQAAHRVDRGEIQERLGESFLGAFLWLLGAFWKEFRG